MKREGQRERERLRTRAAILDATEALMREEGYAAVSSRRVAERAGLKSQLVHYHFGTMDELFLALFKRADEAYRAGNAAALASDDPLRGLWRFSIGGGGIDVALELVALSNHRKALQAELARATERVRAAETAALSATLDDAPGHSPQVVSFLIAAVSRALVTEANMGVTTGHAEIVAYMTALFDRLRPGGSD